MRDVEPRLAAGATASMQLVHAHQAAQHGCSEEGVLMSTCCTGSNMLCQPGRRRFMAFGPCPEPHVRDHMLHQIVMQPTSSLAGRSPGVRQAAAHPQPRRSGHLMSMALQVSDLALEGFVVPFATRSAHAQVPLRKPRASSLCMLPHLCAGGYNSCAGGHGARLRAGRSATRQRQWRRPPRWRCLPQTAARSGLYASVFQREACKSPQRTCLSAQVGARSQG